MEGMGRRRFGVEVAGRRLAVEELSPAGPAAGGPPLVFLHEGLGSVAMWKDVPARLCARLGLRGVAYDRPGHGASGPPPGPRGPRYLHEEAEIVLPGLLDALGIGGEVLLVGHSDGGTIALLFAAAFPERVAALVAIAAHAFVEEKALAGIRAAVEAYERGGLKAGLARHHGEATEAVFRTWSDTWLAPWFRGWSIEDALPRIAAPALIVQGDADAYATPGHVDAIARGIGPSARTLLLPGLGHAPHLEDRAGTVDAIAAFLAHALAAVDRRPPPA